MPADEESSEDGSGPADEPAAPDETASGGTDVGDEEPVEDAGFGDPSEEAGYDEPMEDVGDGGAADDIDGEGSMESVDDTESEDEFTDAGGQVVAEPPAGRPEVSADEEQAPDDEPEPAENGAKSDVPPDVRKYDRFKKVDGAQYDRVNDFLRDRTYITAREWAIARLCADFRTETGVEMTKIGDNLPHLVPFMTDTYTPQAVNQARSSFEKKVRKAGATFLYGAMSDFFTADELDDLMYEVTEVAKFLLEVEGVDLAVAEELDSEERISSVMREVRQASDELRYEGTTCPECGHEIGGHDHD